MTDRLEEIERKDPPGNTDRFSRDVIEGSLIQRFEAIVRSHPNRIALIDRGERWTYEALNRFANRIAHAILIRAEGSEEPVPVVLGHNASAVAAVVGVLKARKPYCVLNASHPRARLGHILRELEPKTVVTDVANASLVRELDGSLRHLIMIDEIDESLPASDPDSAAFSNTAAIFYTSGSTGEPKGVVHSHQLMLHRIWFETEANHISNNDRISSLFSLSFGASVVDLFGALLNGATLCIYDLKAEGLGGLTAWLTEEQVTFLHIPVAVARQFLNSLPEARQFPIVRHFTPSGAIYRADLDRFWRCFPNAELVTHMGASETSGIARMAVTRETAFAGDIVPLGYPVPDKQIQIFDEAGSPLPPGHVGEIAVRSSFLFSGYWRRPDLTAKVLSKDPEGGDRRIYRLGDLGRISADGCLEYVGRRDAQVKIRGYRVEIGEVEAAIHRQKGIKEAAVVARETQPGEKTLIGYIVFRSDADAANVNDLRLALRAELPDYMAPASLMVMDELPRTDNGKVDATKLPDPERNRPSIATSYASPRNALEMEIAELWAALLELDRIGIHDNFLELGGHSLLAMRLQSRILSRYGVRLSMPLLFDSATVAAQAGAIAEELAQGGEKAAGVIQGNRSIPRRTSSEAPVLSFSQQRVWFLAQLEPDSPLYNLSKAVHIRGALNREALSEAFNAVIARHETLRTTFVLRDGGPVQIVAPTATLDLPFVDLRPISAPEREVEVQQVAAEFGRRPFNLSKDLMIRGLLLQVADDEYDLLWTIHHIASDAWSTGILFKELTSFYLQFCGGEPFQAPELPIQYADFAVFQRRRFQGERLLSELAHWRSQLADLPPVLELPADHPRPAASSHRGLRQILQLSGKLSDGIKAFSRHEGVTPYMALLAAFQALLHRYTGMTDIIVGSNIAGRDSIDTERLIGFFVNTLVLRTDLSGNPTFRQLLAKVRDVSLTAYAHQELPFERLVEEVQPSRSLSHHPLFQVAFVMRDAADELKLAGLTLTSRDVEHDTAKFDLTFAFKNTSSKEDLCGFLEYSTDLFETATIVRMLRHFENVVEAMIENPDERIDACSLLTPAESHQLLVEWNGAAIQFAKATSIQQLFEMQAEHAPKATAVVSEDQRISYLDLNQRANQLAHFLRDRGVVRGSIVGICIERSPEIVVALLAVLKAGAAYLPLDSSYPKERLDLMLRDASPAVVLASERFRQSLPNYAARAIFLDSEWTTINQYSRDNPDVFVDRDDLAYVIYTSGSTGKPKGVQIPHRAVTNHLQWMQREFPLTSDDRVLQRTRCSFDLSVWEFFAPLLAGACLVVPPPSDERDGGELVRMIQTFSATVLQVVPSLLRMLLDEASFGNCATLRRVFCGGEQLTGDLLDRFVTMLPAELCNLYGPTEACINATFFRCARDSRHDRAVPIGGPVANVQACVLDSRMQLAPIGIPGELYIGGECLARGYLNRPDLTAEAFVPNPFSESPGSRLYRTGDLVRRGVDGNLEFLGRIDQQVKVRGFRMELGEIESALASHHAIRQAVVVLHEVNAGDQRLVTYIITHNGRALPASELKKFLADKLPDFMIPSGFVFLDAFPLTPNGKIDRRSLPAAGSEVSGSNGSAVPPRTPVEQVLAMIWKEVLKLDRIGVSDNFFDAGGHSLLATQVAARVRSILRIDMPVRRLFEAPTVERLSQAIIADERQPGQLDKIARVVMKIAAMAPEEAGRLLEEKRRQERGH